MKKGDSTNASIDPVSRLASTIAAPANGESRSARTGGVDLMQGEGRLVRNENLARVAEITGPQGMRNRRNSSAQAKPRGHNQNLPGSRKQGRLQVQGKGSNARYIYVTKGRQKESERVHRAN